MPTKDAEKNREHVRRANEKKKKNIKNTSQPMNKNTGTIKRKTLEMMNIRSNKPNI